MDLNNRPADCDAIDISRKILKLCNVLSYYFERAIKRANSIKLVKML